MTDRPDQQDDQDPENKIPEDELEPPAITRERDSDIPTPGRGWKVMRYDQETGHVISGANARIRMPLHPGAEITMPGQGLWLGLTPDYVLTHYAVHELNLLLEVTFDPHDILEGNLTDREAEFSVSRATVISMALYDDEGTLIDISEG